MVVDLQQKPEAIALVRQITLIGFRRTDGKRVFQGNSHMSGDGAHEFDIRGTEFKSLFPGENQSPEFCSRVEIGNMYALSA